MKTRWFQLGIRDLLGLTTIVGLGILVLFARRENATMRETYSRLFPSPHIWLWSPGCLTDRMANSGSIGIAGTLYHSSDRIFGSTPTLTAKLIDPATQTTIAEISDYEMVKTPTGHDFGLTLRHPGVVPKPGVYLLLVEAFDNSTPIARTCTALELIDWRTISN